MADYADHIWEMKDLGPVQISGRVEEIWRSYMGNEELENPGDGRL